MMPKKVCCDCKHHKLSKDDDGGTVCRIGNYQDQSINLQHHDRNWAMRCSHFKKKEEPSDA